MVSLIEVGCDCCDGGGSLGMADPSCEVIGNELGYALVDVDIRFSGGEILNVFMKPCDVEKANESDEEVEVEEVEDDKKFQIVVMENVDHVLSLDDEAEKPLETEAINEDEQIKKAQLQFDEKVKRREAIWAEMDRIWENMEAQNEALKAKHLRLRAAWQSIESKRQQIEHVERVINKVKNACAVEDINSRIDKVEDMIKGGTLCLEDEIQLTLEIKQLERRRAQLAIDMVSPDKMQHALDQKDQIEEHLKDLRNELEALKDDVSKAEVATKVAGNIMKKKFAEELHRERELLVQYFAASHSYREAYGHLHSLKKDKADKIKSFYAYEEALVAARKKASHNQMDAEEDFGRDYTSTHNMLAKPNTRDEPSRVLYNDSNQEAVSNPGPTPDEIISTSASSKLETQERVKYVKDDQIEEKVLEEIEQMVKNEELAKEEEKTVELMKKEEIEVRLKEKIQLEEKAKANEAREKKKGTAENAQTWAEVQAQKEAQRKEQARLKRLRKRERKRAGGAADSSSSSVDGGDAAESNKTKQVETTTGKPQQLPPPSHFLSRQLKPRFITPPPVVAAATRNRKHWRHWENMAIAVMILVLYVFFI